jgi:hypothetical protein
MYSTCLYCSRDLGANDAIETLPIGRRIAFDEGTGRLWVVCKSCEKWNLVPFDNRLETIDACERFFRDAKLKFSTDNIGIARLPEGLELVRIGRAERHEFAAWRYGDQFGRRRRNTYLKVAAGGVALVGVAALRHAFAPWMVLPAGFGGYAGQFIRPAVRLYSDRRVVTTVNDPAGGTLVVTASQARAAQFVIDRAGAMKLHVRGHESARAGFATDWSSQYLTLTDDQAVGALGQLLPAVNASGARRDAVRDAVDLMGDKKSPAEVITTPSTGRSRTLASRIMARLVVSQRVDRRQREALEVGADHDQAYRLGNVPAIGRLALEMMAHQDTERAALAGQLKLLERQWKEADKLAKIADGLALPEDVEAELERRRKG